MTTLIEKIGELVVAVGQRGSHRHDLEDLGDRITDLISEIVGESELGMDHEEAARSVLAERIKEGVEAVTRSRGHAITRAVLVELERWENGE